MLWHGCERAVFSLLFVSSKSGSQALVLEDYDLGIQNKWFFQSTPGHVFCVYSREDVLSCYLCQLMQPEMSNTVVAGVVTGRSEVPCAQAWEAQSHSQKMVFEVENRLQGLY